MMRSIDESPDQGHHWGAQRAADPALIVLFRVRGQSEIGERVGRPAIAAASVGGPVCVVDFQEPWHKVSVDLLTHELRHCAGWLHK